MGDSTAATGEGSTKAKKTIVVMDAARNDVHAAVKMQRLQCDSGDVDVAVDSGGVLGDTGGSHAQDVGGEQFDAQLA